MTCSPNHGLIAKGWIGLPVAVIALLAVGCLALAPQLAQAATKDARAETKDDILHTPQRLRSQERQQTDAGRRINTVVKRIAWLQEDLDSNKLASKAGSEKIDKMNQSLATVGNTNVPKVVGLLRAARGDLDQAFGHLEGADREIEVIIQQLGKAVDGASSVLLDERLLRELRQIIKSEEFLKQQTAAWGKSIAHASEANKPAAAKAAAAKKDQLRLEGAQRAVLHRYERFLKLLTGRKEQADEGVNKRFAAAEKLLVNNTTAPKRRLREASQRIFNARAIEAVGAQERALKTLRTAEGILTGKESYGDLLKDLEQILEEMKQLKDDVDQVDEKLFPKREFSNTRAQFNRQCVQTREDLYLWVGIEELQGGPLEAPLRDALAAVVRACKRGFTDKSNAVKELAAAIAALERALAAVAEAVEAETAKLQEAEETGSKSPADGEGDTSTASDPNQDPEPPGDGVESFLEGWPGYEDVSPVSGSEILLAASPTEGDGAGATGVGTGGDGSGKGVLEGGQNLGGESQGAEQDSTGTGGIEEGGDGDGGDGTDGGDPNSTSIGTRSSDAPPREAGAPSDEENPGRSGPMPPGAGKGNAASGRTSFDADPGDSDDDSSNARGKKVTRTAQARDAVSRRRRSAAIHKYVQQLPPEFRRQVAEYYEALAQ